MCTWRQKLPKKYNYKFIYYFLHSLPLQVITLPRFCFETFLARYVCLTISGHPFLLKETFFPIFPSLLLYECICKNAKTKTNNQRKNSVKNVNVTNKPLRVPKTFTFKMRPSAQPFLWNWVLFAWEWTFISISKAEHLISFWYRGPEELRNGVLYMVSVDNQTS